MRFSKRSLLMSFEHSIQVLGQNVKNIVKSPSVDMVDNPAVDLGIENQGFRYWVLYQGSLPG